MKYLLQFTLLFFVSFAFAQVDNVEDIEAVEIHGTVKNDKNANVALFKMVPDVDSLESVDNYIKSYNTLPGFSTDGKVLSEDGKGGHQVNMKDFSVQLLRTVEDLYIHTIEQQKLIDKQQTQIDILLKLAGK